MLNNNGGKGAIFASEFEIFRMTQHSKLSIVKELVPKATQIRLGIIWLLVGIFIIGGSNWFHSTMSVSVALIGFFVLLATIITASFGVVKEADALASKLGEPYGTLILTLSIVSIEVILIVAVFLGEAENPTIGKDSIFSVMMIIMNLVIGLAILVGGLRYKEQEYNVQGSTSYMGMIAMLAGVSFVIPSFLTDTGGVFTPVQALFISLLIIVLYSFFLYYQTKSYSYMYTQPASGKMEIKYPVQSSTDGNQRMDKKEDSQSTGVDIMRLVGHTLLLLAMILPIVILSSSLAVVVDYGIVSTGLPKAVGGVLIATIVFTPESLTSIKAAWNNEFQRVINLCHGAFVSTLCLTVPSVLLIGMWTDKKVLFGMSAIENVLLVCTVLLSFITFSGRRTTPVMGVMHLVLFAVFLLFLFTS